MACASVGSWTVGRVESDRDFGGWGMGGEEMRCQVTAVSHRSPYGEGDFAVLGDRSPYGERERQETGVGASGRW